MDDSFPVSSLNAIVATVGALVILNLELTPALLALIHGVVIFGLPEG